MALNVVNVLDFGLSAAPEFDNSGPLQHAFFKCSGEGSHILTFEPGTYHFYPESAAEVRCWISNNEGGDKRVAFPILNYNDITINGKGSEFIFHGEMMPFVIDGSTNVTILNLIVGYSQPPVLYGRITEIAGDVVRLDLTPELDYRIDDGVLRIIGENCEWGTCGFIELDALSKAPAYATGDTWGDANTPWYTSFKGIGRHSLEFSPSRDVTPGNHIVFVRPDRQNPAFFATGSKNIHVENVEVHLACAMAFIAQRTDCITLNRFNVRVRPGTDHLVSASADATHFVNCRGEVVIDDCDFESQLDDPMNVHGVYTKVLKVLSSREIVLGRMHKEQAGIPVFAEGDEAAFIDPHTLQAIGSAMVSQVEEINSAEFKITLHSDLPEGPERECCWITSPGSPTYISGIAVPGKIGPADS